MRSLSRRVPVLALAGVLLLPACHNGATGPEPPAPLKPGAGLDAVLESHRAAARLPALAAVVVSSTDTIAAGVVGVRRLGAEQRATLDDPFHLGSITKSMTATVAARLVERGVIGWETTIARALPAFSDSLHPAFRDVTLSQLLAMRAGVTGTIPPLLWTGAWNNLDLPPLEQRARLLRAVLSNPPVHEAGGRWQYSNASVSMAGHMLERVTGTPWEELMSRELFDPLQLRTAGFGAPGHDGVGAPWGHRPGNTGLNSVPPGRLADNPPGIGPAGTVHMSIRDAGRYAAMHLAAARGSASLLSPGSAGVLHTPLGPVPMPPYRETGYALGWVTGLDDRAGGTRVLLHDGSNTMFYALMWIAPERDRAIVVVTNAGSPAAGTTVERTLADLIARYAAR